MALSAAGIFTGRVEQSGAERLSRVQEHERGVVGLDLGGEALRVRACPDPGAHRWSLIAQLEGEGQIGQLGHRWELRPRSLLLIDARAESWLSMDSLFCQAVMLVPAELFPADTHPSEGLLEGHGRRADRLRVAALAAWRAAGSGRAELLSAAVGLLCESSLAAPRPLPPPFRLRQALRTIEARLGDPSLDPEAVALAQGVSRRWLDAMFASIGTTVAGAIAERRLAAARVAVEQTAQPMLEIALSCGFPSAAAFSHAFRRRFGVAPSKMRGLVARAAPS